MTWATFFWVLFVIWVALRGYSGRGGWTWETAGSDLLFVILIGTLGWAQFGAPVR